jgi:REP element-mobilizing transposase RayT/transcriptional regulator with XRE-family HTH domain
VERRDIFLDDQDRQSFVDRLATLMEQMGMECLAWALMSNHVHLLLRPSGNNLGQFMRRLLTGHAVMFNLRHRRNGHLFQNRYKSIICEEDPYLLELVRYIHLNPLRVGLVGSIGELRLYPWSGHAVLMGARELAGQRVEEVLLYFSKRRKSAREKYEAFVADGVERGKREELVGGGLRRVLKTAGDGFISAYDDRILGSGDFVEQLRQEKGLSEKLEAFLPLEQLIDKVAEVSGIDREILCQRRRGSSLSEAKSIICYVATRIFGYSGETVAKALGITRSGVCRGSLRGKEIAAQGSLLWGQIERLINKSTTSP